MTFNFSTIALCSHPESVALFTDKFIVKSKFVVDYLQHLEVLEFKRKKKAEEKAKLSRDAKDKSYEDYTWTELCEDLTKLKSNVFQNKTST